VRLVRHADDQAQATAAKAEDVAVGGDGCVGKRQNVAGGLPLIPGLVR
jgi:hypothetical protein